MMNTARRKTKGRAYQVRVFIDVPPKMQDYVPVVYFLL
jgi:hypothetical protein